MPLHDWSLVDDNTFHGFHVLWTVRLHEALNGGILPAGFYAMPEQRVMGGLEPDVLTFQASDTPNGHAVGGDGTVATLPEIEVAGEYLPTLPRRRRHLAIRRTSDDRLVAVLEVVSRGNKSNRHDAAAFVRKALEMFDDNVHFLMLDVHPHGSFDPNGLHNLIWRELDDTLPLLPADKPATFASFDAAGRIRAYVRTAAVGEPLPTMPLFLMPDHCVGVPLEAVYGLSFAALPPQRRRLLEPPADSPR